MKRTIIILFSALLITNTAALSQTFSTIKSGRFFDSSIWMNGKVPGSYGSTFFFSTSEKSYIIDGVQVNINDSVTIDGNDFTDTTVKYFVNNSNGTLEINAGGVLTVKNLELLVNKGNLTNNGEVVCESDLRNYWLRYNNGRPSLCTEGTIVNNGSFCIKSPLTENCQTEGISGNEIVLCDVTSTAPTQRLMKSVKVFPNPCSNRINVTWFNGNQGSISITDIRVFDITGNQIDKIHISAHGETEYQIDISDLNSGSYYILLSTASGKGAGRGFFTKVN